MPTVPRLTAPRVAPAVVRPPTSPAIAEPEAAVAQTLGAFGEMFQRERQRQGEIRLNVAESDVRLLRQQIATDVSAMQGVNALNAVEQAEQRFRDGVTKIESELRDPAVRRQFQMRAQILGGELVERARAHALQQSEAVDDARTKANLADDMEQLASADLTDADAIVERMSLNQRSYLTRKGLPTEAVDRSVEELVSAARVSQVQGLVDLKDTDAAKGLLEAKAGQFLAKDLERARKLVTDADLLVKAQQAEDAILAEFGGNERAALKAVRERYTDQMRDMVTARVERRYATTERLRREDIQAVSTRAEAAVYAGNSIADRDRLYLMENAPRVLHALERMATQVDRGIPVQTDLAAYQELVELLVPERRAEFLDTNLLEYADRISTTDLKQFIDAQVGLRGGSKTASAGVSTATVLTELFQQAKVSGLFREKVEKFGDIERFPEDKNIFTTLRTQVEINLTAKREEQRGELSSAQVRQVIRETLDGYVIESRGFPMFRKRTLVPREGASDEAVAGRAIQEMGGRPTPAKIRAIMLLKDRTDLTPAQKRAEAERIATGL